MNNNTTSIYNGGAAAGVFPNIFVTFMLEKETHFNSVKFNSNNEFIPSDGLVIGMRNAILHLK